MGQGLISSGYTINPGINNVWSKRNSYFRRRRKEFCQKRMARRTVSYRTTKETFKTKRLWIRVSNSAERSNKTKTKTGFDYNLVAFSRIASS